MPEIKNTFTQGKMNKDLDERILPNGQYRHAENIKVSTSDDAAVGTVQNILGNEALETIVPSSYLCVGSVSDEKTNNIYWFVTNNLDTNAVLQYNDDSEETKVVLADKQNILNFSDKIITGLNVIDNLLFFTDNVNEPKKINVDVCIAGTDQFGTDLNSIAHTELIVDGVNKGDIKEEHITVIKKNPRSVLDAKAIAPTSQTSTKLFEKIFPRFSYRYKYQDGEYSAFGPFTDVMFNPLYPDGYGKDDAYSPVESYNVAMSNNTESVELNNFVTKDTPSDVAEIEILYKQEGTNVVYSIKKIKYNDAIWTANTYVVKSESIYAALPENQLLRSFDVVPKKALSQEITGNRIVYGNYTQGYDLIDSTGAYISTNSFNADYDLRDSNYSFDNGGVPSVKSQRKYQVGFVFGDKYGRETTVFTSDDGFVEIPWFNFEKSTIGKSASQALQLKANLNTEIPSWADYYKYYIKETSNEYYNMVMERAYVPSELNVFDEEEDHVWISFPSADRNKITPEDYLILKKRVGGNEEQISIENKFKILDIVNEAPDAIKLEYVKIGEAKQTDGGLASDFLTDSTSGLMRNQDKRIDSETDMVFVRRDSWINDCFGGSLTDDANNEKMYVDNMYMSFKVSPTSGQIQSSERYKVVSIFVLNNNYQIKLNRKITLSDAQLANKNGIANDPATNNQLKDDLIVMFERKQEKELDEFSGKFFVKIVASEAARSNITNNSQPNLIDNFVVTVKKSIRWYVDAQSTNFDPSLGIVNTNVLPYDNTYAGTHNALDSINGAATLTSTELAWNEVLTSNETFNGSNYIDEVGNTSGGRSRTFFIDNAYFVAGQWSESTYARNSGQTWGGSYLVPQLKEFVWKEENGVTNFFLQNTPQEIPIYAAGDSSLPIAFSWNGNDGIDADRYVNGMEGYVNSTGEEHTADFTTGNVLDSWKGYRRWRSQSPVSNSYLKDLTYSLESGKKYLHLSFLAPGVDLHDGNFNPLNNTSPNKGSDSISAYLQGIWGGGVFKANGVGDQFALYMEGNFDASGNALADAPGPGIGQGYNDDYRDQHENQWNPAYPANEDHNGLIKDFVANLKEGSRFKFTHDTDETVITIKSMSVKRIYNHTPWNAYKKYDGAGVLINQGGDHTKVADNTMVTFGGDSVEEAAIDFINSGLQSDFNTLTERIENFGKRNNRRVTYIFEIDTDISSLLASSDTLDADGGTSLHGIQFLSDDPTVLAGQIKDAPAIWETEPKEETGLDIYYEASQAFPTRLTSENNTLFAPIGSKVKMFRNTSATVGQYNIIQETFVRDWVGDNDVRFDPLQDGGFNRRNVAGGLIDYTDAIIMFYRPDGSYTSGRIISEGGLTSPAPQTIQSFFIRLDHTLENGLSWYNCFSFGNGIESDRIRDDYNAPQISNGVRASITLEQDYKEEHRKHGLIYSGIYNSTSGINELNQFIAAQQITKDLNPTYGSIQKLFQRRISLVAFCEDRVVSITSNKDALFNADGNSQLVSTNNVLGDATPFVGDFGISKNPESFAKESYRAYFADKQRGAVLRLSMDGITPISEAGMSDYFRDNLSSTTNIIGSYDSYSKNYNITLAPPNDLSNLISNSSLSSGSQSVPAVNSQIVINGTPTNITPLQLPSINLSTDNLTGNSTLQSETEIFNVPARLKGSLVAETFQPSTTVVTSNTTFGTGGFANQFYQMSVTKDNPFVNDGTIFGQDNYIARSHTDILYPQGTTFASNQSSGIYQYPSVAPGYVLAEYPISGKFYDGTGGDFGEPDETYWNPTDTSYTGTYQGTTSTSGNPWFYDSGFNGIILDGQVGVGVYLPGERDADSNTPNISNLPNNISNVYPGARDNTIFNGEEVRIAFYMKMDSDFMSTQLNNPSYPAPFSRRVHVQLFELGTGNTVANSNPVDPSYILDPNTTLLTAGTEFSSYQTTPNTSTYKVGYQNTNYYSFTPISTSQNKYYEIFFKFTDGTENEGIVVENLGVYITIVDDTGYPNARVHGALGSLNIRKVFRMETAYEQTVIPGASNNDAIPSINVPDFVGVRHNIYQWSDDADHGAVNAIAAYGPDFDVYLASETAQGQSVSYPAPNGSSVDPSGYGLTLGPDVDNGVVAYNDGSGAPNMYGVAPTSSTPSGTYFVTPLIDDSIQLDSSQLNISLQQVSTQFNNVQTVTGDTYVVDVVYTGTLNFPNAVPGPNFSSVSIKTLYGVDPVTGNPITYLPAVQFTQQTVSDFYSTPTNVLRASFTGNANINDIDIIVNAVDITITDIHMVNISATYTGGTASNWSIATTSPVNSLSVPEVYADTIDGFVFTSSATPSNYLRQMFPMPPGLPATTFGYTLEFEVSNYVGGTLDVALFGDTSGYFYNKIEADGVYSINANLDGTSGSNNVLLNGLVDGQTAAFPGTPPMPRNLTFVPNNTVGFFEGNVSNISLVDNTNYFTAGGTIGSFTTSGFDPLQNNYIDFDPVNERVIFSNAPALTAPFPGPFPFTTPVQLNQLISTNLNTGNTYRLKFDYLSSTGGISGYYFNSTGKGFRFTVPAGTSTYSQIHTIGDDTIVPGSHELTSTLVFFVSSPVVSTALDNISLQQTFSNYEARTISYSENVRGWTSFKSFVLENGNSLSSNYYTFKNGKLFKHNSAAVPRNEFYGTQYSSSITAILNDSPSVVKSFNALNYEGTQSNVIQGIAGQTLSTYNEQAKDGWSVDLIKTDKQEGSVKEFIEKEGKWFNYIKGKANTSNTSDLSLQGIGVAIDVI